MRTEIGVAMAIIVAAAAVFSFSHRDTPALSAPTPDVQKMQVNLIEKTKAGVVAAGELGHIEYSRDGGKVWANARTDPNRHAQITDMSFYDGLMGVAVGHEGWVLMTKDGGKSWEEVSFDKDAQTANALMAVERLPSGMWLAVGAFGTALRSMNDGISWQKFELMPPIDEYTPFDRHMNKIIHSPDRMTWILLGETGTIIVSHDEGINWKQIEPFYDGSFYGGVALNDTDWVIYGMRGNVYYSRDAGETWQKSEVPMTISTFDHYMESPDLLYLVGQGGVIFQSTDGGQSFTVVREGPQPALLDIEKDPSGTGWLIATEDGVRRYSKDFKTIDEDFEAFAHPSLSAKPGTGVDEGKQSGAQNTVPTEDSAQAKEIELSSVADAA